MPNLHWGTIAFMKGAKTHNKEFAYNYQCFLKSISFGQEKKQPTLHDHIMMISHTNGLGLENNYNTGLCF